MGLVGFSRIEVRSSAGAIVIKGSHQRVKIISSHQGLTLVVIKGLTSRVNIKG